MPQLLKKANITWLIMSFDKIFGDITKGVYLSVMRNTFATVQPSTVGMKIDN